MKQNLHNIFHLQKNSIPFTCRSIYLCQIDLGPLRAYNFMFFKWAQSCAMYFSPFFTPNFGMSHNAILRPWCLVNVSHLQPMIFSLFSINEHIQHFTTFINPPLDTKPFAYKLPIQFEICKCCHKIFFESSLLFFLLLTRWNKKRVVRRRIR